MTNTVLVSQNKEWVNLLEPLLSVCLEHNVKKVSSFAELEDLFLEKLPDVVIFDIDSVSKYPSSQFIDFKQTRGTLYLLMAKEYEPNLGQKYHFITSPPSTDMFFVLSTLKTLIHSCIELKVNNWNLNIQKQSINRGNRPPIYLTDLETSLLYTLMSRPGDVYTIDQLVRAGWGENAAKEGVIDPSTPRKAIQTIRKKLGSKVIGTERGKGYTFSG
jgi:hypothetical protein